MLISTPFTVDGKPPLGTYGGGSFAELAELCDARMNLLLGGHAHLDLGTPEGAFCRDNGIKIIYHLTQHLYGNPRLAQDVTAAQTTIPLEFVPATHRDSHVVEIEGERIRYREMTDSALVGCERGCEGTTAAAHHRGIILFWPAPLEAEVRKVKDSPNLWGYYVLDDSPGDAISALRGMYAAIQRVDPVRHPVCAGYSRAVGPMRNFGPGVCDIMLCYFYPVVEGRYNRNFVSREMQWLLSQARRLVPGIPFFGVYQAFWGTDIYDETPVTPRQMREQMEDFVRDGACGLVAFIAYSRERGEGFSGWNTRPDLREEMRRINDEILSTGGLSVPGEPPELACRRIQPVGFWTDPQPIPGLVTAWHVVGPFKDAANRVLDAVFPPETETDLGATYEGARGPVGWRIYSHEDVFRLSNILTPHAVHTPGWWKDLDNVVAYLTCTVESVRKQEATLQIGSDDDAIIWINGQQVWRHEGERAIHRDQDTARVTLPAGASRILMKVYNRKAVWGASLRITDEAGRALDGITITPTAEDVETR